MAGTKPSIIASWTPSSPRYRKPSRPDMPETVTDGLVRCGWAAREPNLSYHDSEWGVPLHAERKWFEFLVLDGAQAGLSWETILNKRDNYRAAFDNFQPALVAAYDAARIETLLANP